MKIMTQKSDSEDRGNTRARSWCLTIFNEKERDIFIKEKEKAKYLICGEEKCPSTGKLHYQCYIYYENQRWFTSLKKQFPSSHIEKAKGNAKENKAYCSKDKKFEEHGECPEQGKKKVDLKDTDKKIIEEHPYHAKALLHAKNKLLSEENWIKSLYEVKEDKIKYPDIIYITGNSGSGKSLLSRKMAVEKYKPEDIGLIKFGNNFGNGVGHMKKCLIFEEFRSSCLSASDFLVATDKYGGMLNVKGDSFYIKPEMVIINSIIPPSELYKDDEISQQFLRRITRTIHL